MASPGSEERLLTLYADIHYYFSEPDSRPTQHRFDKESYVYLYRDAKSGRGRLEVANHAGTPEQDAFTGYLDNITIYQSFRHPNLCTVTVNGASTTPQPDDHWRLPSTDPRDEGKYLFKLNTLDLYFWTEADAAQFVHAIASSLRREQLKVDTLPLPSPSTHEQPVNPVVQNLENLAISHGSTGNAKESGTRDSSSLRTSQTADRAPSTQSNNSASTPAAARSVQGSSAPPQTEQAFTPLAYNPAAPAAPEKHTHREKTPPPPEGVQGTGLAAAAARDEGRYAPQQSQASFGPTATPSFGPGAPSTINPSPAANTHGAQSYTPGPSPFSPMPGSISSAPLSPSSQTSQNHTPFPGPPSRTMTGQSASSAGGKADQTPTHEILGPNFGHPSVPLQHLQPQYADYLAQRVSQNTPPSTHSQDYHAPGHKPSSEHQLPDNIRIGGYSDFNYASPPSQQNAAAYHDANPYQTGDYAIHQQVYRPTEEEAAHDHGSSHGKRSSKSKSSDDRPGKLEAGAEKVEKKVNRFLRGIEKKLG